MNPLILRLGIGVCAVVVACVVAIVTHRRERPQFQPTFSSFDGSSKTDCCICLDELPVASGHGLVSLPCKHRFHRCCIEALFSVEALTYTCPLCRKRVDSALVASILRRTDF